MLKKVAVVIAAMVLFSWQGAEAAGAKDTPHNNLAVGGWGMDVSCPFCWIPNTFVVSPAFWNESMIMSMGPFDVDRFSGREETRWTDGRLAGCFFYKENHKLEGAANALGMMLMVASIFAR